MVALRVTAIVLWILAANVPYVESDSDYSARYVCQHKPKLFLFYFRDYNGKFAKVQASRDCLATSKVEGSDKKTVLYTVIIKEEDFDKCGVKGPAHNKTVDFEAYFGQSNSSFLTDGVRIPVKCDFTKDGLQGIVISADVHNCYERHTSAGGKGANYPTPEFYCDVTKKCIPRSKRCNRSPQLEGCYDDYGNENGCDAYNKYLYNVRKLDIRNKPIIYCYRGFCYYVMPGKDDVATEEDINAPKNKVNYKLEDGDLLTHSACSYGSVGEYLTWYNVRRKQAKLKGCFGFFDGFAVILKNSCVDMVAKGDNPDGYFETISQVTCGSSSVHVSLSMLIVMVVMRGVFGKFTL